MMVVGSILGVLNGSGGAYTSVYAPPEPFGASKVLLTTIILDFEGYSVKTYLGSWGGHLCLPGRCLLQIMNGGHECLSYG